MAVDGTGVGSTTVRIPVVTVDMAAEHHCLRSPCLGRVRARYMAR